MSSQMVVFIISCTPFCVLCLIHFLAWRSILKDRKKEWEKLTILFDKLVKRYALVKIGDLKLYNNRIFINSEYVYSGGVKIRHYKNELFLNNLARIAKH